VARGGGSLSGRARGFLVPETTAVEAPALPKEKGARSRFESRIRDE
jgi:hypothetical protein